MRIFFLVNGVRKPGPRLKNDVERCREVLLSSAGAKDHRIEISDSIPDAQRLVEVAAREEYDTLWIGGGDGTINVLLNETMGRDFTLGVVPMGTVNALARSLEIPLDPARAVQFLLASSSAPFDVCKVNDRHFLCFASVGFDASVVHSVKGTFKRVFGRVAYAVGGIRAALGMKRIVPFRVAFEDGENREGGPAGEAQTGHSLVVSNICNYAGLPMFHGTATNPGKMDMWLFQRNSLIDMVGWSAACWLQSASLKRRFPGVSEYTPATFSVTSDQPMYLQVDGEAAHSGNDCRFDFACLPKAIRLLLPAKSN